MNADEVDELVADYWDERRAAKRDAARWRALGLPDDCDPAEVRAMLIAAAEMVFAMHGSGVDIPPKRLALARHIEEQGASDWDDSDKWPERQEQ